MKANNKSVNTIPDGAWEAGCTDNTLRNSHKGGAAMDGQKNGYPPQEGSVEPLPESTRERQDGPGGD